jgi:hypothetical protein
MQHGESKEEGQESCEEEEVTAFELSAGERVKTLRSPIQDSISARASGHNRFWRLASAADLTLRRRIEPI